MYNIDSKTDKTQFTDLPDIKEANSIDISKYNIRQTDLLCWLDNNTKVKHVLKYEGENIYYIFFKHQDERHLLLEFLSTKVISKKAA